MPGDPDIRAAQTASTEFVPPSLQGAHVHLRPVLPSDLGFLQATELMSDLRYRWRFRGATPNAEQWVQALWAGVLAQFLVLVPGSDQPRGLVSAYRANFQDGYAFIGAARFGAAARSPIVMLGLGLFIDYVFTCWNLRKLYLETPEFNYGQFASGLDRYFVLEGRLREHYFVGGTYWDQLTLAIYRDAWAEHGRRLLEVERPRGRVMRVRVPPRQEGSDL